MTRSKLGSLSIASLVCLVLLAPVVTFTSAPAAAAVGSDTADTYVVEQGGQCIQLEAHGDGTETIESFYDYRTPYTDPSAWDYSSYGTEDIQENQVSKLFVHEGSEGTSLVFLHDKRENTEHQPYGSTMTLEMGGLPEGDWAVRDDTYDDGSQDDDWSTGGSTAAIDWKWREDRSDGGAYRGLHNMDSDDAITIDPGFNEEADHWNDWGWSGDSDNRTTEWVARSGDGTETGLDMSQSITIRRGICGSDETAPTADANASATTVAPGEDVTFDAGDSTDDVGIETYEWDLDGDGTVDATGETVEHSYETGGSYDATLTAADAAGNENTDTVTVSVEADDGNETADAPPTARASADPSTVTAGETVSFDGTGSNDSQGIESYTWEFGDGNTGDGATPSHTYASAGTYNAALSVTDADGNRDTDTVTVTVEDAAESDARPTAALAVQGSATVGETVTFAATESDDDAGIVEYRWDVDGDGEIDQTTTRPLIEHSFSETGDHTVGVTVADGADQTDSDTATVSVSSSDDDSDDGSDGDDSDDSDDTDDSDDGDDTDDSNESDDNDDADEEDESDDEDDSTGGSPSSGGPSGSTGSSDSSADESPSANVDRTDDGRFVVTVENAAEGDAVTANVSDAENETGLRGVELVPATDADELNVTLVPRDDVSAPNGTDAGLYELRAENASDVANLTYRVAVERADLGESGEPRVLSGNSSGASAVNHTVVENGSTMVVEATTDDVERVVLAAVAPDVSASSVTTADTPIPGEPATVEATIANDGHVDANRSVNLTVDGTVVDSRNVTVAAGDETAVSFETTFESAGEQRISVAGTERTVSVGDATETVDGDSSTEGDETDSSNDTATSDLGPTNSQYSGLAVAGFGILIIGAAALFRVL